MSHELQRRISNLKKKIDDFPWHIDLEDPDERDRAFVQDVKQSLLHRDLSLDAILELYRPHSEAEKKRTAASMARHQKQREVNPENELFGVWNTSDRRMLVIAMDVATAKDFAFFRGHVQDRSNARIQRYSKGYVDGLKRDGSALGRALREGVPGVVEERGRNVVIGDRVFTPIFVISD